MARPLRIEYHGAFYHVISRGNERKNIFFTEQDKEKFLEYIELAYLRHKFKVHAYSLMDNHYHIFIETPYGGISKIMQYINGSYSTYINKKMKRVGHLFQGRPKIILVEADEYAVELSRYIHLNATEAKIVRDPSQDKWSSFGYYSKDQKIPRYMEVGLVLGQFGRKARQARKQYVRFIMDGIKNGMANPLEEVIGGVLLGSKEFVERVNNKYLGAASDDREISMKRELRKINTEELIKIVDTNCSNLEETQSYKLKAYIMRKHSGLTLSEIGSLYGKKVSAMNQIIRRIRRNIRDDKKLTEIVRAIDNDISEKCNVEL